MIEPLLYWLKGLTTCRVYVACRMTGRSRKEMIKRAKKVSDVFRMAGIEAISPIIREHVRARPGTLKNPSKLRLFGKWRDDKDILAWECHGMAWDEADDKSKGAEREYGICRFLWWKPVASIVNEPHGITVAAFEDDLVAGDLESVAHFFAENHGNIYRRIKWRLAMLNRSLPRFLMGQMWQFLH